MDLASGLLLGVAMIVSVSLASAVVMRRFGRLQKGWPFYVCFVLLLVPYAYLVVPSLGLSELNNTIALAGGVVVFLIVSQYFCGQRTK